MQVADSNMRCEIYFRPPLVRRLNSEFQHESVKPTKKIEVKAQIGNIESDVDSRARLLNARSVRCLGMFREKHSVWQISF